MGGSGSKVETNEKQFIIRKRRTMLMKNFTKDSLKECAVGQEKGLKMKEIVIGDKTAKCWPNGEITNLSFL